MLFYDLMIWTSWVFRSLCFAGQWHKLWAYGILQPRQSGQCNDASSLTGNPVENLELRMFANASSHVLLGQPHTVAAIDNI